MAQLLLFTLLCLSLSPASAATKYTLSDLEVLANEGSHEEFFKHAMDINPSDRQEIWKGMVTKMGDGLSKALLNKSEIRSSDFEQIEGLYTWPTLRNDDIFRSRRQEIGLRFLKDCLKSENPCHKSLKSFWEADKTDPETAFKLAELLEHQDKNDPLVWNLLEVSLKSGLSEFYCKKEFVMKNLWQKLEVDYARLGIQGDFLKKIDETIHPDCLPVLTLEAKKRLVSPQKSGDREFSFQILNAQGKADQNTSDFFFTVYLLEQPSQGHLFNYSWNRLKELGKSFSRREAVLSLLKTIDPLPDEIMGSLDQTKKRVVLTHFKQNFPEYLDFYSDQCVLFYGGKGAFPNGNPTVHCQDLMKSELAPQFLDEIRIKKFQEVQKI